MAQSFVMTVDYEGGENTAGVFDSGTGEFESYWVADRYSLAEITGEDEDSNLGMYDRVTAGCIDMGETLYLGTHLGHVLSFKLPTGEPLCNDFDRWGQLVASDVMRAFDRGGGKDAYMKYMNDIAGFFEVGLEGRVVDCYKQFAGNSLNLLAYDMAYEGVRRINGFAMHDGKMYDVSALGVRATEDDDYVSQTHWGTSLFEYEGRLLYVPTRPMVVKNIIDPKEKIENPGSLVDAITGDVIHKRFTPFDGSGYKQAEYVVFGDVVYMHHGDYPGERISQFNFKTMKQVGESVGVHSSFGFVEHQGVVYDLHSWGDVRDVMPVDQQHEEPSIFADRGLSSVVSDDDRLFLTENVGPNTNILAVDVDNDQSEKIGQVKGYARFLMS